MTNYLIETDGKYCLILILNIRSDIWLCSENGILFHNIPPLNWCINMQELQWIRQWLQVATTIRLISHAVTIQ